jgi:hypothetical protein
MAAASLSEPGTEYGPCAEQCEHRDCAESRKMAATTCKRCGQSIGYRRAFYIEYGVPDGLEHAVCLEMDLAVKA